ncbi:transcription factor S-II domain-containing protein [Cryptosporidium andersoni]|uniref:DNA-directed RNA polymerase I subunit RPA12 n=1 Tax=Cryptosporidium andersoni TaxID=117008 RepID=A0A1J4MT06_9CRYT|nr:transcription factor S-II domain-containing protein [Cryptosporidium andersoni]
MNTFDKDFLKFPNDIIRNVKDNQTSQELVNLDLSMLQDIVDMYIYNGELLSTSYNKFGPPRFQYNYKSTDNFDTLLTRGCPNCGSAYDISYCISKYHRQLLMDKSNKKVEGYLECKVCNYKATKLHSPNESDSILDFLEKSTTTKDSDIYEPNKEIYICGFRQYQNFDITGKWWQNKENIKKNLKNTKEKGKVDSDVILRTLDAMEKAKAPKIKEICPKCSHNEAFFTQFQARSADEGTTVMYECCKCHYRRVVNN